jgi:hypothetical protein
MDLTKEFPRSVKDKLAGVVMIGRASDKGRAFAAGTNGEYNYDCPMDKAVFSFLGIDKEQFLEVLKKSAGDAEVEAYVKQFTAKKTQAEIDEWNANFLNYGPAKGSEGEAYFLELRNSIDPSRTDITTWADLLDLDEKRPVPHRTAA